VYDAWTGDWKKGEDEDGNPIWDVEGYLARSLDFAGRTFDVVLLWTALDYLPEALVAPVVTHLATAMNPGGQVMAFFHTKTQGDESDALPLPRDRHRRRGCAVDAAVPHTACVYQPQHRAAVCGMVGASASFWPRTAFQK